MGLFGFVSCIGRKITGKGSEADERVREFLEANREVIGNPDLIFVGQKIRIPKRSA
jgi:nucleoid-associated protein YgaU